MAIQWFPGHMHKAQKEIRKALPTVDIVIEILDARIPFSSENPMIQKLRYGKPCIKVLNKSDLADPALTQRWQLHFESESSVRTLATQMDDTTGIKKINALCKKLLPHHNGIKPIHTMIMGIPNVGKSTIINILAGRTIAKTGNEPAVTKAQQRINLGNGITLSDTPGVLWPNLENKNSGYRLASTGAIKDTAIEHSDIALYIIQYLKDHYPDILQARYLLDSLKDDPLEILQVIGKKRGCLAAGGLIDFDKAAKIIINELRTGMLGRYTMETPETMQIELAEVEIIHAEKVEKKKAKGDNRIKKKR